MIILLFFAFLAGFVTIAAPCIWPLLPIILSVSSTGSRRKALGVVLGIMTSFAIFTLSISYLEKFLHIDPNVFRLVAVIALILFGVAMLVPSLGIVLESAINRLLAPFRTRFKAGEAGFTQGYLIGFSTGLVWAPCSGPILGTVATLAAIQAVNFRIILVALVYILGLGIPLFLFALAGNWFFNFSKRLSRYTAAIQRVFGLLIIVAAVLIYTNYDKVIQLRILKIFPSYGNFLNKVEDNPEVSERLSELLDQTEVLKPAVAVSEKLPDYGEAPELAGIAEWLNTSVPLSLAQMRGKVVLLDFWTYTCINCVRTLPHVKGWYEKYKDDNFVVIGVHTPEFAFEKSTANVMGALKQFNIHYPVALDNDYETWRAYRNRYWPSHYLIDINGHIRYKHFGEGDYEEMDKAIRSLLKEAGYRVSGKEASSHADTAPFGVTPETYLGRSRIKYCVSREKVKGGRQTFSLPERIGKNCFAYDGVWDISDESATPKKGSALEIHFNASKVFLVVSPGADGDRIKLFMDGELLDSGKAGADVIRGYLILDTNRLYNLVDLKGKVESHLLRLEFEDDGDALYAFTFG